MYTGFEMTNEIMSLACLANYNKQMCTNVLFTCKRGLHDSPYKGLLCNNLNLDLRPRLQADN